MGQWAVVITEERYRSERLFHHDRLELDDDAVAPTGPAPAPGDEVLVVADRPERAVVALGRFVGGATTPKAAGAAGAAGAAPGAGKPGLAVAYTRRLFDDPAPLGDLALDGTLSPVEPAAFRALAERLTPARDPRTWLVSVDLPIEADSPAEAVRRFWSYVRELGPRELPAFVSPSGDELAMQAFVLGEQANLDPEEDD